MAEAIFKLKLRAYFERVSFLELDMDQILNQSMLIFEDYSGKMAKSTSRQAWTCFLE